MTINIIEDFITSVNRNLQSLNADCKIGVELRLPIELEYGDFTYTTDLTVHLDEDGIDIPNKDEQIRRIREEVRSELTKAIKNDNNAD
jgi:hypothetical protein